MAILKLSSPWMIYQRKLAAFFREDPGVNILYDEDAKEVKLYIENAAKADALSQLLPHEKKFGNVTLKVTVHSGNLGSTSKMTLFGRALDGNRAVAYMKTVSCLAGDMAYFIVFKKEVVQYFTDDIGDLHGIHSTIYQDLANDIFENHENVFFCTDVDDINTICKTWP